MATCIAGLKLVSKPVVYFLPCSILILQPLVDLTVIGHLSELVGSIIKIPRTRVC